MSDTPQPPGSPPPASGGEDGIGARATQPQFPYVARPLWWFVVLNVATAGLFQVVFFYRGWAYLRDRRGLDVWPLARALFAPLFAYPFFRRYFTLAREQGYPESPPAGPLAVAFIVFNMVGTLLPPPASLVSLFSVMTLLPAAETQNFVWRNDAPDAPGMLWLSWTEMFLVGLGVFFWLTVVAVIRDPSLLPAPAVP